MYSSLFYLTFFVYLTTFRYPGLSGLYALFALILFLKYRPVKSDRSFERKEAILTLVIVLNLVLVPIWGVNWREISFLIYFSFLFLAFDNIETDFSTFLKFVNITYVIYVVLSYLVYFNYFNSGFRSAADVGINQFDDLLFGRDITTLIGFDGSTGGIDAYSMLVLILNFVFRKERPEGWFIILLALVNVVWSLRLTPWAMAVVPLIYFVLPSSIQKTKKIVFVSLIFVSFLVPTLIGYLMSIDDLVFGAITHGRADIWSGYFLLLRDSSLPHVLFGFRDHDLPFVEVWGGTALLNNPHSSYLRILLSFGIVMFACFFILICRLLLKLEEKKSIYVALAILIAAITSDTIFYNHNPVFLFTLFVVSSSKTKYIHGTREDRKGSRFGRIQTRTT